MNFNKKPFSDLNDSYLTKEIYQYNNIDTNLGSLKGAWLVPFSRSLLSSSEIEPARIILQRIMISNPIIFEPQSVLAMTSSEISKVPVLAKLGMRDYTLRMLIALLYELGELSPLKTILIKAPPYIKNLFPKKSQIITPGQKIIFEIRTVFLSELTWMMKSNQGHCQLLDSIELKDCSRNRMEYKTKLSDEGTIYIKLTSRGNIEVKSEEMCVMDSKSESYVDVYKEIEKTQKGMIVRVALLIGIMKYVSNVPLKAPKPDILKLRKVLTRIGFKVYCFSDVNKKKLIEILDVFAKEFTKENSYVFFYYAGHGAVRDGKDFIQLIEHQDELEIGKVLNHISVNKPKPLLAIFDMCRDSKDKSMDDAEDVRKMCLPYSKELILVMSTFPLEESYEGPVGGEMTSVIMRALCECLETHACSEYINDAMTKFSNDPSHKLQKPIIQSGPMRFIFGDKSLPAHDMFLKCEWIKKPLPLGAHFDVFHNMVLISIEENNSYYIRDNRHSKNLNINLFNGQQTIDETNSFIVKVYECELKENMELWTPHRFKIVLPSDIARFLR